MAGFIGRQYGPGETRDLNATIKVYTAAELRSALTKIYARPNGVGSIEICGDIVLSEPIELKAYYDIVPQQPKQITITAINGARIYSASTAVYDYATANVTGMPVFDFGVLPNTAVGLLCKYIFIGLNIGADDASPFGSLVAADVVDGVAGAQVIAPECTITNLRSIDLQCVFGAYSSTGTFGDDGLGTISDVLWYASTVNGFTMQNSTDISLNSAYASLANCTIQNVSPWNVVRSQSGSDQLRVISTPNTTKNNLIGIGCKITLQAYVTSTNIALSGNFNLITGSDMQSFGDYAGWSYVAGQGGHVYQAESQSISHSVVSPATLPYSGGQIPSNVFHSTWVEAGSGDGSSMAVLTGLPRDGQYTVSYAISAKFMTGAFVDSVNSYIVQATIKTNNAGTASIVSTSCVMAVEEVPGVISGITPVVSAPFVFLAPQASTFDTLWVSVTVDLHGIWLPLFGNPYT